MQDENEEMGRELAEGKVHGLEQQVALAKGFVEDLRMRYLELEDHTHTLDAEAEDLTRQVHLMWPPSPVQLQGVCLSEDMISSWESQCG